MKSPEPIAYSTHAKARILMQMEIDAAPNVGVRDITLEVRKLPVVYDSRGYLKGDIRFTEMLLSLANSALFEERGAEIGRAHV